MFFVFAVISIYLGEVIGGWAFVAFIASITIYGMARPESVTASIAKWFWGLLAVFGIGSALFGIFGGKE